jgi:hypothetical protein
LCGHVPPGIVNTPRITPKCGVAITYPASGQGFWHFTCARHRGVKRLGPCPRLPQVIFPKNLDHNAKGHVSFWTKKLPYFGRRNAMGMGLTVILFHIVHRRFRVIFCFQTPPPTRWINTGFSAQQISWPKPQNSIKTHLMTPLHTKRESHKRHRLDARVKALCHTHHITMVRGLLMRCPAMCHCPYQV